jgi:RNA polymerase sigma-70 factor (ECF subfamily)
MDAHARADSDAVVAMMREDVRFTMPPQPTLYQGRDELAGFFAEAFGPRAAGEFRLVATSANRHPAAANYVRAPGDTVFRAMSLDVLRFEGGQLVEITTFDTTLFPLFGLPDVLPETDLPATD